jgi:hypothetical protein
MHSIMPRRPHRQLRAAALKENAGAKVNDAKTTAAHKSAPAGRRAVTLS